MVEYSTHSNGMLYRTQLYQHLIILKHFKYVSYLERIDADTHVIRFYIADFDVIGIPTQDHTQDWIVTEKKGYLSGVSLCGTLRCEVLS